MLYIVYLDEFGHIGPYIGPNDPKHKTHPVFGLAGIALPASKVRGFSTFFFQLKNRLLAFELNQAQKDTGIHAANWEKKGAALYTQKNVEKYRELRSATFRLFNKIKKDEGFVFYVGIEKHMAADESNAKGLYKQVMHEMIKRLDAECDQKNAKFMVIFDQQDDMRECGKDKGLRYEIVKGAAISMFGGDGRKNLIEPPVQAESHLYQTLQCADWICGLVGRLTRYEVEPNHFPGYKIFETYFADRLKQITRRSSIRKKPIIPTPPSIVSP